MYVLQRKTMITYASINIYNCNSNKNLINLLNKKKYLKKKPMVIDGNLGRECLYNLK